ncbi:MAG: hypothetical protein ABL949_01750 [Fimbriimonadaceae bacterium]
MKPLTVCRDCRVRYVPNIRLLHKSYDQGPLLLRNPTRYSEDIDPTGEFDINTSNKAFFRMLTRVSEDAKLLIPTHGGLISSVIFAFRYTHDSIHTLVRPNKKTERPWRSIVDALSLSREQVEKALLLGLFSSDPDKWCSAYMSHASMKKLRDHWRAEESTKRLGRFQEQLPKAKVILDTIMDQLELTPDQRKALKAKAESGKVPAELRNDYVEFPTGNKILEEIKSGDLRDSLSYLHDEFFDPLSGYVHCGFQKILGYQIQHAMPSLEERMRANYIERHTTEAFIVSYLSGALACFEIACMMPSATESNERVTEFWNMIMPMSLRTKAVWKMYAGKHLELKARANSNMVSESHPVIK